MSGSFRRAPVCSASRFRLQSGAIDVTRAKRGVIVLAMAAMTAAAVIIFAAPTFWPMALANSILALAGDAFVPAASALTLGLVAKDALARRLGRNSAFDHAGNTFIAIVAGALGYAFSQRAVFFMVPVFAALTSAAVLAIPADVINYNRARDLASDGEAQGSAAGYRVLVQTRLLPIFALCAFFFHFANAPLLPLVGQKLALEFPKEATAMMSFCIVAAQGVMLPIATSSAAMRTVWAAGRSSSSPSSCRSGPPSTPCRTTPSGSSGCSCSTESALEFYGALTPLVIADIMRGTGRYNLAQGAVATTQGVGASVSALAAGELVDHFGYSASFLFLAAAAGVACLVFRLFMPETRNGEARASLPANLVPEGAPGE